MLCLSRKTNESVQIGDAITVTIVRISNGKVRLSIDAPRELNIARSELMADCLADRKREFEKGND